MKRCLGAKRHMKGLCHLPKLTLIDVGHGVQNDEKRQEQCDEIAVRQQPAFASVTRDTGAGSPAQSHGDLVQVSRLPSSWW